MKKKEKGKIENLYKEEIINLKEFNELLSDEQYKKVEEILNKMYENKVEIDKAYVMKCIKLSVAKKDDSMYLPYNLVVDKDDKEMVFSFRKHRNAFLLFLMFFGILIVALFSATYSAIFYLKQEEINVDIDGDGIADINIDKDGDNIADINIDKTKDNKPNINIDYKGNRMAVFNLDINNDGEADTNLVNNAEGDNLKTCKINCDTNGDGWPDINYDTDGDGVPDFDIDLDGDGVPDLNIDLDGDMKCDLMCDTTGDNVCDTSCIKSDGGIKGSGSSSVTGEPSSNLSTSQLLVYYEDYGELIVDGLFPDDQENVDIFVPKKLFTITNDSAYTVQYKLSWIVTKNTFTSNNFKYKIIATNGGYNQEFTTAPWEDIVITTTATIGPYITQKYTIEFNLEGTHEPQDYDQGKMFASYIKVGD